MDKEKQKARIARFGHFIWCSGTVGDSDQMAKAMLESFLVTAEEKYGIKKVSHFAFLEGSGLKDVVMCMERFSEDKNVALIMHDVDFSIEENQRVMEMWGGVDLLLVLNDPREEELEAANRLGIPVMDVRFTEGG